MSDKASSRAVGPDPSASPSCPCRRALPSRVIIERTSGLVVDRLLAAGHPVVPVHPHPVLGGTSALGRLRQRPLPNDPAIPALAVLVLGWLEPAAIGQPGCSRGQSYEA